MSVKQASRPFRILALPLARVPHGELRVRPSASASASAKTAAGGAEKASSTAAVSKDADSDQVKETPLILYVTQQPDPPKEEGNPPIYKRALDKAAEQWIALGQKPKDSWMRWFYTKGESLMDRIEYEEWALKSIHENQGIKVKDGKVLEKIEVPLYRPAATSLGLPPLLPKLHRSLIHRIPHHRKLMYRCLILSPLTWPFAIIPVIPNFPLFYVLWRAWSHYKAWRGALYLDTLIKNGVVVEKASERLTEIYDAPAIAVPRKAEDNRAPDETRAATPQDEDVQTGGTPGPAEDATLADAQALPDQAKGETPGAAADGTATPDKLVFSGADGDKPAAVVPSPATARHPDLLLTKGQVPALERAFDLRQQEVIDVNRAIEQADQRVRAAEAKLKAQAK